MFEKLEGQATGTSAGLTRVIQTRGARATPSPSVQLYTFAVPLPAEAVGVGGVWTQTTHDGARPSKDGGAPSLGKLLARTSAAHTRQTERYTLVERQGPILTIDYEMRLESDEPEQAPTQTGSGRFVVALGDPLAQAGAFDFIVPMAFPGEDGGEARTHEWRQRIELEAL